MRRRLLGTLLLVGCTTAPAVPDPAADRHRIVFLGAAQDGGLPHLGCEQPICEEARRDPAKVQQVAALGLAAPDGRWWLFDATPDLPQQVHAMGGLPAGIFLTHAHIGHYTGLMHLGREVAATDRMPVHCSPAMAAFLRTNAPWDQLVRLNQIELRPYRFDEPVELGAGLSVTPWQVPHRDEYADTSGFRIAAPGGKSALYVPDIDRWEEWDRDIRALAAEVDVLILDGSFFSGDELPGRDMRTIPHPTVRSTMDRLQPAVGASAARVIFTHHNHTNPLWDTRSAASRELRDRGFETAARLSSVDLAD